jgi:RsiW-degrading membrane proteinase PrsW (M82 family)
VPALTTEQPRFALPARLRYKARPRAWLESRALRIGAVFTILAICGAAILAIVQHQTGTEGFLVGLVLAVLPVPLVLGVFLWIDRVDPEPVPNLLFCFAWGACAATLIAITANSWTTGLLISHQGTGGQQVGASFVAPLVEETAKGASILLLFLIRRRDFDGIVDGIVYAGFTATGFAFTENVLYIGRTVLEEHADGGGIGITVFTFLLREVMSPFAHPLFTAMTGIGFGLAAIARNRLLRILAPIAGWVCAMVMHGAWNGSSGFGILGFLGVYLCFMLPVFCLMVWLVLWARKDELKSVARQLPVYAWAGWLTAPEPLVLSAMATRRQARDLARYSQGAIGEQVMREYQAFATSLAFLRQRAERGTVRGKGSPLPEGLGEAFSEREQELLHHLWSRKDRLSEVFAQVGAREWYRRQGHRAWPPPMPYGAPMPYSAPVPYAGSPGPAAPAAGRRPWPPPQSAYPHPPAYAYGYAPQQPNRMDHPADTPEDPSAWPPPRQADRQDGRPPSPSGAPGASPEASPGGPPSRDPFAPPAR